VNRRKTQRLDREEGLSVRKRPGRNKAVGTRAPLLTVAEPDARWSVDFVHPLLHLRKQAIFNRRLWLQPDERRWSEQVPSKNAGALQ